MGHRISKIYTKTGDDGSTGLGDGSRVKKDCLRVECYGTIDEANSAIGIVLSHKIVPQEIRVCLEQVQHDLFELGSELCLPGYQAMTHYMTEFLEKALDNFNADLPMLKEFVLPGGNAAAAHCHLARTISRRAERRLISLKEKETVRDECITYINRLSDLLFVIARVLARIDGEEVLWNHNKQQTKE